MRREFIFPLAIAASFRPLTSRVEEGTGGHYVRGATPTFIDALPGSPAIVTANAFIYYHANASVSEPVEFGGQVTLNARAAAYRG